MQFDPSEIDIPFIPIEKIWEIAEHFRSEHWPSGKLPIDITDIVEIGLNLYIVPESRLKDKFDIDAYLTMDCTSIYVDLQALRMIRCKTDPISNPKPIKN